MKPTATTALPRLALQQRIGMLLFASGWLALMFHMSQWLTPSA
ncbi:hypothetical protein [Caldimonas brevitalea]|uniref:Uncharacterized protein n=1 Tax=Caldimonas brevitalea TaxID=413882 RepID=A0A0G3BUI6_9BURK|nr:hypothetical protein [Caldimonas brevitalea]AKJ31683.1 hypothetical protein AAW51_4992 [Caldimonas brevitalea]